MQIALLVSYDPEVDPSFAYWDLRAGNLCRAPLCDASKCCPLASVGNASLTLLLTPQLSLGGSNPECLPCHNATSRC